LREPLGDFLTNLWFISAGLIEAVPNSQDMAGNFLQEDLAIYAEAQVFTHEQSIAENFAMVYK
jgi:hypothetical protein